jgi:hypothetical protein
VTLNPNLAGFFKELERLPIVLPDAPEVGLSDPTHYSDGTAVLIRCAFCGRRLEPDPPYCARCDSSRYEVIPEAELPDYQEGGAYA